MNITASNGVMNLGHQLDNLATVISFPIGDIIADQGAGGSWSVRIQRNGDVAAYPSSNFSISNNNLNLIMTSSDLANVGEGQIQLKYAVGSKVLMSRVYKFYSHYSLDGSGTVPAPWQSWVDAVEADADRAEEAVAHYPYVDTTTKHWMQWDVEDEQFVDTGIVAEGQDGEDGADGEDGVSPVANVNKVGKVATITITDATGTTTATVSDGNDGATGPAGADGYSPSATVSKSGSVATITITDKDGTTTAQVSDGQTQDLSAYRKAAQQDVIDATLQPKTDNLLSTTSKNIVGAINEVDSIALGANQALGVANYQTLVTMMNGATASAYRVGQNIYVQTLNVPDVWVYSVESSSVPYTYTTDEALATALDSGAVQMGYYKISKLEGQKVDLTNYVQKTNYATGSTSGVVITNSYYGAVTDSDGYLKGEGKDYSTYTSDSPATLLVSKSTLENVITGKGLVSNTDYASTAKGGVIQINANNGFSMAGAFLYVLTKTNAEYNSASNNLAISKGTLNNVLAGKNISDVTNETFTFTMSDGQQIVKTMKVGA